jgi:hypothetical protein
MKRLLFILIGLLVIAPGADASGGRASWANAEVARQDPDDGWSPRVGGVQLRVYDAAQAAGGGLSCKFTVHATAAAAGRFAPLEKINLRFFDANGRLLGDRPGIGFATNVPVWKGGALEIGLGTGAGPAGTRMISIELEGFKVQTRKLRVAGAR